MKMMIVIFIPCAFVSLAFRSLTPCLFLLSSLSLSLFKLSLKNLSHSIKYEQNIHAALILLLMISLSRSLARLLVCVLSNQLM